MSTPVDAAAPSASPEAVRGRATLIGLTAIAMWSTLGVCAAATGSVPPFLMNALCFSISGGLAVAWLAARGRLRRALTQPLAAWALGVAGLFGYHALYFAAFRSAAAVPVNLINYLWPLLIVLFSGLLPGERLRRAHIFGALLGFLGAALVVGGQGAALSLTEGAGYLAALAAAITWATYSVVSRRFASVPSEAVAGFCVVTALLSFVCHFLFEPAGLPTDTTTWLLIVGAGLFPVGLSFFVWDYGMKRGDIQFLGVAAYATPILSTLLLVGAGFGTFTPAVIAGAVLVTGGAVLASADALRRRK
ncbi:aromatic amino acid exporter YddG [Segnochrobactraceae bacterium EtOH-i3]